MEWLPDVQEDVGWIREQVLKVLQRVLRQASKSVFQHVSARYVWLPSYIQVLQHPGLNCTSLSAGIQPAGSLQLWPQGGSEGFIWGLNAVSCG